MNPRLIKTKAALLDALIRLLENDPLDAITISDLCKEAKINRTTFYKYYSVPEDLITEAVENMLQGVMYSGHGSTRTAYDYMLQCCRVLYDNQLLMYALLNTRTDLSVLVFRLARKNYDLSFLYRNDNIFISGGVLSVLNAWMHRNFEESPEEIAKILSGYINKLLPQEETI